LARRAREYVSKHSFVSLLMRVDEAYPGRAAPTRDDPEPIAKPTGEPPPGNRTYSIAPCKNYMRFRKTWPLPGLRTRRGWVERPVLRQPMNDSLITKDHRPGLRGINRWRSFFAAPTRLTVTEVRREARYLVPDDADLLARNALAVCWPPPSSARLEA